MIRNFDLALLRAFVAIAETGSLSKAAESMFRSQSTISLQLKKLEDALEMKLFDRTVNGLVITRNGRVFIEHAYELLATNDKILSKLSGIPSSTTIRAGFSEEIRIRSTARVLSLFHERHPDVLADISVQESRELKAKLRAGRLDLAVVKIDPLFESDTILTSERLIWVIGNGQEALLHRHPVPVVAAAPPSIHTRHMTEALDRHGIAYQAICTADSHRALISAVAGGLGVGVVGAHALEPGIHPVPPGLLPSLPATYLSLIRTDNGALAELSSLAEIVAEEIGGRPHGTTKDGIIPEPQPEKA